MYVACAPLWMESTNCEPRGICTGAKGALTAVAPKVVAFLLPDQRKTVSDTAVQVAAQMTDAAVKNGLNDFVRTVGG